MEKYSKELITNYINGNDIGDYDLNELENDKLFMTKVIEFSNDEKMYNLCSDNLKKDYEFVKYLISKFKDNIDFITMVADYFIENDDVNMDKDMDYERLELLIIMRELTKNYKQINQYNILCDSMFCGKRVEIELYKLHKEEYEFAENLGMGFLNIYDLYNNSEIILKYYAKKMIEAIFDEFDIDLEKLLHNKFKTPDEIDKQGLNNFMLNFIEPYDQMLASYASTNLDVLLPFKENIIEIQKNWDIYIEECEEKRYDEMFEKVSEYMDNVESIFKDTFLIYYIGQKLGILDKIEQYDFEGGNAEFFLDEFSDDYVKITLMNFTERIHYKNVTDIMTKTLFGENINTVSNDNKDITKQNGCKILKFNKNNNRKN